MKRWLALLACAALVACSSIIEPTTRDRMADRLAITDTSSEQAVRSELEARFPIGTSRADVLAFLRGQGFADDSHSALNADAREAIECRFTNNPDRFAGTRQERWFVTFRFDDADALEEIHVHLQVIAL